MQYINPVTATIYSKPNPDFLQLLVNEVVIANNINIVTASMTASMAFCRAGANHRLHRQNIR